ncbi:MAG: molybdopterin-dependent oxidoreductase [Myxococcota bacterium]
MTTRRVFLKATSGAALGLYLSPIACESNQITPKVTGGRFDFLTPVDVSTNRRNRPIDSHFVQFGGEGSVPSWNYDTVAEIDRSAWSISLQGLFTTPGELTFADIDAAVADDQAVTVLNTLRCIFDSTGIPGLVGTALWRGVPLSTFLEAAGVDSTVQRFRIFSRDGFTNNLRRDDVFVPVDEIERSPLLAYQVNGADIPHIHGGPVRLLVPGRYGYKSMKWVERIEATDDDAVFGSYQDAFGFFDDGTIQLATKVTDPLASAELRAGRLELFGYALSGDKTVGSVEVSIDDGPFEPTVLEPFETLAEQNPELSETLQAQIGRTYPYRGVWTLFRFSWDATPGTHRLQFRAIDSDGLIQVVSDTDPTDGFSGYWDIQVQVV